MKALTRAVLLGALSFYIDRHVLDGDHKTKAEARRLHAMITGIEPDTVPIPDGEQMDTMLTRYIEKHGVDAGRLSLENESADLQPAG